MIMRLANKKQRIIKGEAMINFGILGAGDIANAMATTVMQMENVNMYAIASRSIEKAESYKEKYKMEKAYDSYEELVSDEKIDIIYIATPHSHHFEHARLCLEHGKNVLCEKAFTANAKQAEELIKLAEEKDLFLCEAMWTRFMPLTDKLEQLVGDKVIGDIKYMTANLNFPIMHKERMIKPELAGGALLDLGIYPLTIASVVMGDDIDYVKATGILTDSGVDMMGQYTIVYKNNTMADLNSGMCAISDGKAVIYGTNGFIVVDGVNCIQKITVFDLGWGVREVFTKEEQITGYEYEVAACVSAIENGRKECEKMSHSETITMMKLMDEIRKQIGVIYPFDV